MAWSCQGRGPMPGAMGTTAATRRPLRAHRHARGRCSIPATCVPWPGTEICQLRALHKQAHQVAIARLGTRLSGRWPPGIARPRWLECGRALTARPCPLAQARISPERWWPAAVRPGRRIEAKLAEAMDDRQTWEQITAGPRRLAVAADSELRRRHPGTRIEPLRSAEPRAPEDGQISTAQPEAAPRQTPEWVTKLAGQRHTFRKA